MKSKILLMIGVFTLLTFAFAPVSHGDIMWANEVIGSSHVINPTYAADSSGGPNGISAFMNAPFGYLTVGFGSNFFDLGGSDVVVVDGLNDSFKLGRLEIGDIYVMQARRVEDSGWSGLTYDESTGGWRYLEINGNFTGMYDYIRLTSLFGGNNEYFEVDAIGVNHAIPTPEPSTLLLLGSGLVAIATWGRKKFKGKIA